jgi:hypothetical protein
MIKSHKQLRAEFVARLAAKGISDPAINSRKNATTYVLMTKGRRENGMVVMVPEQHVQFRTKQGWRVLKL